MTYSTLQKFTKTKPSVSSCVVAIRYAHIRDLRQGKRVVSVLSPLQGRMQDFLKEGVVSMRVEGKCLRAEEMREGKGKGNIVCRFSSF